MIESVFHQPYGSFAFPLDSNTLRVRVRVKKNEAKKITVLLGDRYRLVAYDQPFVMEKIASDELFDFFQADLISKTRRIRYVFLSKEKIIPFGMVIKELTKNVCWPEIFNFHT